LSRVDPVTYELNVWNDPIPGQTVMGVPADKEYIYFTTNASGEGLPVKENMNPAGSESGSRVRVSSRSMRWVWGM